MTKIIGLLQVKGGVGKSTIATNLAGIFAKNNRVALLDCDQPQTTSASWYSVRQEANNEVNLTLLLPLSADAMIKEIEVIKPDYDLIIIDSPARVSAVLRATLILADLALVPITPSIPDIWAANDLMETVEKAKKYRDDVKITFLWNKIREGTRAARELTAAVKDEFSAREMKARLSQRVAYQDAYGEGKTVMEWTDKSAKQEMMGLCKEIAKELKLKVEP